MLIECPECKKQISDTVPTCPHCGYVMHHPKADIAPVTAQKRSPVLFTISAIALALSLITPRILFFFPMMIALGCAAASLIRKESIRPGAIAVLVLGVGLLLLVESGSGVGPGSVANLEAAQIADWNWNKDPNFAGHGVIKWNVTVRNVSSRPIDSVRVEFTTFDGQGKMVATTFTYVHAIPPGETRSEDSFADLYRTEERAEVKIADVNFAN